MKPVAKQYPPLTKDILRMSLPHVRGDVLDYGAGTAKYKEMIIPHTKTYIAFDMIEGANIDVVGDVLAPPFSPESFDTVICTQVMEHVKEPWVMIEKIHTILRPGGICILTTPFVMPHHADPYDFFRFTLDGGKHLFERTGMTIVDSGKYGGTLMILAELWKFSFCNPYVHKNPGFLRRNIFRLVYRTLTKFSGNTRQNTPNYADIFIIARKP